MPSFGKKSLVQFNTLHPNLKLWLNVCIQVVDFSIIEGLRDRETQDLYFQLETSHLKYPESRHNRTKDPALQEMSSSFSDAVDVIPYPSGYTNPELQIYQAGIMLGIAILMGLNIRWGGMWDGKRINNQEGNFWDPWHFEIIH